MTDLKCHIQNLPILILSVSHTHTHTLSLSQTLIFEYSLIVRYVVLRYLVVIIED